MVADQMVACLSALMGRLNVSVMPQPRRDGCLAGKYTIEYYIKSLCLGGAREDRRLLRVPVGDGIT